MKIVITENQKYTILKRYWDMLTSEGGDPSIDETILQMFEFGNEDHDDIRFALINYLGGPKIAIKKTEDILNNMEWSSIDTGEIETEWKYVKTLSTRYDNYVFINISVKVKYGEGADIVEEFDMMEYFEFKEYLSDMINDYLYNKITSKTGVEIFCQEIISF